MTPTRHQRKRTKGYRMPPGVVYVGRPGKWGNPFETAEMFRSALEIMVEHDWVTTLLFGSFRQADHMRWIADHIDELRGRDVACWCSLDSACHGDALIEFANREVV